MVKLVSWNVNGIRACTKNGFPTWLKGSGADIICLQEVRAEEHQIPVEIKELGLYEATWHGAQKKGYSGVGILSRSKPIKIIAGIKNPEFDVEGRVITAEFDKVVAVSAYFPNSQDGGARIAYKVRFCEHIHQWVNDLRKDLKKPVVLAGDYNIAHQPIDLARPTENEGTAGYLPEEREWMGRFLESGWVDSFRQLYPEDRDRYSWWSMRTRARERNIGWRIDYHAVPVQDKGRIAGAEIFDKVTGSDHCPVTLDLDV